MLKPKVLTQVLNQANSGGVKSTLLLTTEGSLLACAGYDDQEMHVAALAGNIWTSYTKNAEELLDNDPLGMVMIQCMDGKVAITKVADLLLCIYANKDVQLGLLRAKVTALREYLKDPLTQVATAAK
ncbi:ragulator complex protein LAMTOR2-like [Watersipora subatra]|uniref:ragulator complex protein LAMTOR2-like n=1 Tax=Watersipora subatra TaxID=2589382 RepID=UPI00355AF140